jgi:thiol:disulfide interchange protein DsbD
VFGIETFPLPQRFAVRQPLRVPVGTAPGNVPVAGVLDYQLCDENSCEAPDRVRFTATLVVEAGPARGASAVGDEVPSGGSSPLGGSLWALLLACIGGGLFALVMPCTYPMIPITFSFFTKQADARGGRVLPLALVYGAGIVAMFALIGALASVLGGYIVPFAAHWLTNVVIGVAFVLFGLSLVGLINLQPPAFLVSAAGRTRGVGGLVGVLLMGATLVITSFTCTAPVVALLLVPAVQSGDSLRPTLGMAVFGLTMALPFVCLALLPGRVRSLPRSGEWMNTLKVSLGFVELAAALKFFSNAEYVVELHVLPRETFFGIWIALFVALAAFLWGLVPRRTVGAGRRVGGLASLAFAGYCLYGALGYPLDFVMTALAPAYGARDVSAHELVVDDYEAAAARARAQGKLLLVNLTGFTCTNCRMVERGILPADAIAPILERHFVEARLHMDNASVIPPDKWTRHLQLRQDLVDGRVTTPTYVSVDPATGRKLVEHVLSGGPGAWEQGYRAFLEQSLAAAGRELPPR